MKYKIFLAVIIFSTSIFSQSKTEKVKILLDLMESDKSIEVMKNQFIGITRQASPGAPVALIDSLFSHMDKKGLYKITIPIYERNLDEKTIDGLITFYKTEAGRKFIQKIPIIMQESMQAGALWGQQIMTEVINRLKEKGYKVQGI